MSRPLRIGRPALERAVDELAHRGGRFEVYAKAGEILDWRLGPAGEREHRHVREVGVGCRAFLDGRAGFGAAAGSDAASGREAARATLASLVDGPDPLPPRHLLGSSDVPPLPPPTERQACEDFLAVVERRFHRHGARVQLGELRMLVGRSQANIVTGDGYAARADSCACVVEVVLGTRDGPLRVFQAAARSLAELDPETLVRTTREATLLTARGTTPDHGLVDLLVAPPVAAALVAGLADFVFDGSLAAEEKPARVAHTWHLLDERAGPAGLLPLPFDGEGMPARRIVLAADGRLTGRLGIWTDVGRSSAACGAAVRPSYRQPPRAAPANLVVAAKEPVPPDDLLRLLGNGVFAPLCAGALRLDGTGRFALPVAGVSVRRGRVVAAHPWMELRGSFRRLLGGLAACGSDPQSFSLSCGVTTPSLLIHRIEVA